MSELDCSQIKEVTRKYYCEICDKQYKDYMQLQEHLDSYDHHHKKAPDPSTKLTPTPIDSYDALSRALY